MVAWSRTFDRSRVARRSDDRPFQRRSTGTAYHLHHQESTSETSLHGTREGREGGAAALSFLSSEETIDCRQVTSTIASNDT